MFVDKSLNTRRQAVQPLVDKLVNDVSTTRRLFVDKFSRKLSTVRRQVSQIIVKKFVDMVVDCLSTSHRQGRQQVHRQVRRKVVDRVVDRFVDESSTNRRLIVDESSTTRLNVLLNWGYWVIFFLFAAFLPRPNCVGIRWGGTVSL